MPDPLPAAEPPLTQPQREAIFDFLLLGMYADSNLKISESERLYEIASGLDWSSYLDPKQYAETATFRVRAAAETDDGIRDFLAEISGRLADTEVRRFALNLFAQMINADQQISIDEDRIYSAAKVVFGV